MNFNRLGWFTLVVLTSVNLLNYIDRYIFSALLPVIQRDLGFSDTQLGFLGSGFIAAYLFIAPIFGFLGDRGRRSRLMAGGVALWSAATALSGIATTFMGQLLARVAVGVGESAYCVVAPSAVADHFPRSARGKVFAIYSGAIPVGSALGFVLGGFLEPRIGWHKSFFIVGVPGLILATLLLVFMKDPRFHQQEVRESVDSGSGHGISHHTSHHALPFAKVYGLLFRNGGFMATVLGYAAYTFVVGGMSFWMPTYIVRYFEGISLERGNIVFGTVTVAGGFIGTFLGGWWADRTERRSGNGYLKVALWSMIASVPLFWIMLWTRDFTRFSVVLFFMEVALFMCISPLDASVITYVRPGLRSTAIALDIFLIHLLGDGLSRSLMGAVSDASGLRTAIGFLPWMLVLAGVIWGLGLIFFWLPVPWPESALTVPRRQAHRGYRPQSAIQENTLAAFRCAREEGALMSECDVQLCRDGEVIVFHDEDLMRLGRGGPAVQAKRVADLDAGEMKRLTGAPLLRELLTDVASTPLVNIELKTRAVWDGRLERAVVRIVRETGSEGRVLFSSFNPFSLRRLSKLAPSIPRALLVSRAQHAANKLYLRRMLLGCYARPHLLHLDDSMVTKERMHGWSERGIPVVAWTVNSVERIGELFTMGVRGVISDDRIVEEGIEGIKKDSAGGATTVMKQPAG